MTKGRPSVPKDASQRGPGTLTNNKEYCQLMNTECISLSNTLLWSQEVVVGQRESHLKIFTPPDHILWPAHQVWSVFVTHSELSNYIVRCVDQKTVSNSADSPWMSHCCAAVGTPRYLSCNSSTWVTLCAL